MGAGFAAADRFVAEVHENRLRAGYVLLGDEIFLYERCRRAVIDTLVPPELRDFCLSDLDLAETNIFEVLDRAHTPSLMAPFQVVLCARLKALYTRGAKKDEFAAIEPVFPLSESAGLMLFIADLHPHPFRHRAAWTWRTRTATTEFARRSATVRHGGTGPRRRSRCHALDLPPNASDTECSFDRRRPRTGRRPGRGHDAASSASWKSSFFTSADKRQSRWAMSKPWSWPPSSDRSTN